MDYKNIFNLYSCGKFQECLNKIEALKNPDAKIFNLKGLIYFKLNKEIQSADCFLQSINLDPYYTDPLVNLGKFFFKNKNFIKAESYFLKALKLNNSLSICHYFLGHISLSKDGNQEKAEQYFLSSINLKPLNFQYYVTIATFYFNYSNYNQAINYFKKAYQIKNDLTLLKIIGKSYFNLNLLTDSTSYFNQCLKQSSRDDVEVHYLVATNYLYLGQNKKAMQSLRKCLEISPDYSRAHLTISRIKNSEINIDIEYLKLKFEEETNIHGKANLGFAIFNYLDKNREYKLASNYLKKANEFVYSSLNCSLYDDEKEFDIYKSVFTKNFFRDKKFNTKHKEATPIFIVGLPRSGSTMLEHLLSFYENVTSLGEVDYLYRSIERNLKKLDLDKYQSALLHCLKTDSSLSAIKEYYLKLINTNNIFFTDKMLTNFRFIGIIKTCFPHAKILYCNRNKNDNLFSIYSNHLGANSLPWIYNISKLKKYYLSYKNLMGHWTEIFGNEIYGINYEKLIGNFEFEIKKIINYLGLEWNDACLDLKNNNNPIKTASYDQVRQQVYNKHIDHWEHYKNLIPELFD